MRKKNIFLYKMANGLKPTEKKKFHIGYVVLILIIGVVGVFGFLAFDHFTNSAKIQ